jgi:hypothetical protein
MGVPRGEKGEDNVDVHVECYGGWTASYEGRVRLRRYFICTYGKKYGSIYIGQCVCLRGVMIYLDVCRVAVDFFRSLKVLLELFKQPNIALACTYFVPKCKASKDWSE